MKGHTLMGISCVSNVNYQFTVTFTPNNKNNNFFNQGYYQFLQGVAAAGNLSITAVTVSSLVYSSVIMNLLVSTNSSSTGQFNAINSYVTTPNITNLQVASVTSTNNNSNGGSGGSDDNTTTIILATVIPIGTIRTYYYI
jgi:hypothetical protein